jgi:SpoVK/Ycf46/Vps4 family AAA+-type ATPase
LYGPPGTGKTEIARRIAESASCFFLSLTTPDLKAGFVGQTGERVKKVWQQARSRGRCVMFIDECEGVFARRGSSNGDSFSEELVQAFLAEWDGLGTEVQQVWVIGATNRRDLLDDAIVSRFGAAVQIDLPGAPERLQILQFEMEKLERAVPIPAFLGQLTTGMSGRNLARVASEVCTLGAKQGSSITDDTWREVVKRHTKASSETVDEGARWESLILADEVIEKLKTVCESLRNVEDFKAQGFDVPKGALLFGPPGTGKTQIARTLANESGLPFIAASTADLKAGYLGQAGQKVRELFERARGRAPCIVFIDEIEAVAAARGGAGADTLTGEIVNQLLQEMDGVKKSERHVFVLAATNLPASVDPAVLSRFEDQIEIPNPDVEQRERLIRLFLGKLPVDFDRDAVAAELADSTAGLGGRDLRNLIQKASQKAIRRAAGNPRNAKLLREDLLSTTAPVPARTSSPRTTVERPPLH